ncbi:MAG: VanW family protein [Candidatus Andersenbacteria bacterium]
MAASVTLTQRDQVLPRVRLAGLDLGGLTRDGAHKAIAARAKDFSKTSFTFTFQRSNGSTKTFRATVEDLGMVVDVGATTNVAADIGHRDSYLGSLLGQLVAATGGTDADAVVNVNGATLEEFLGTAFLDIEQPARDARLTYKSGSLTVVAARSGNEVNRAAVLASLVHQAARLMHVSTALALVATEPVVTADQLSSTKALATNILSHPINLYYQSKTYAPSKDVVGSWLEFHTLQPGSLLGQADNFDTPAMLVTPFEQERSGQKVGDPYYVLLPPENLASGASSQPRAVVGFNRSELKQWLLDNVSAELDVPGQNARFAFAKGTLTVTSPSKPGTGVDVDQVMRQIVLGERNVRLSLHQTTPSITEDKINELGIETLIGRGVTDASGSPANRFVNIDVGLAKFDGVVIAPNETFSTLKTLGPVDAANGFLPELVISGNKIEPQYGGGLCQVSSTLFRAALDTGLPITERTNHAFVVSHYVYPYDAPGYEATIFEPSPDLKFTNDTDHYILIHTYRQSDDKVVFEFYGTDPHRTTMPSAPYWVSGGPVGGGQTTFTYKVTDDETGKVLQNHEIVSTFQALAKFKLTH